jgi:integrase
MDTTLFAEVWRGLGTNLYHLRVPDKIIQAILRHADLATTMKHYVKVARCESGDGQAESGVEWDVEKEKETVKM